MPDSLAGLLVSIQKNNTYRADGAGMIVGYYNDMQIKPIPNWYGFSPVGLHDGNNGKDFFMKLCFPSDAVQSKIEPYGICYQDWKEDSQQLVSNFPCVCAVLINLTNSYKNPNGGGLFGQLLFDLAQRLFRTFSQEKLQAAHCCVFPTLGYSDFCILFAENSWNMCLQVTSQLHREVTDADYPILSTDYSIPAYFGKAQQVSGNLFPAGVLLSSRLTLKPGYTPENVKQFLDDTIPEHKFPDIDLQVFEINDSADCLLSAHSPDASAKLLKLTLCVRSKPASSMSQDLQRMLLSSKSRLQRTVGDPASPAVMHSLDSKCPILDTLFDTLTNYRHALEDAGRNLRQANALLETAHSLADICQRPHSQDLYQVLEPLLTAFNACMEDLTSIIRKNSQLQAGFWNETQKTLELFRSRVGGYVADLTRSDCFSMETEQYNHPSVGSATMLLLSFNRIVNALSDKILSGTQSKHGLLLTCGGCERTLTNRMFYSLAPEVAADGKSLQEHLPFVMQVSEVGLFDCGSTLLRLTHETMHFCGDRQRGSRAKHIQEFLSVQAGQKLAEALLVEPVQADMDQRILLQANYTDASKGDAFREAAASALAIRQTQLAQDVSEVLADRLKREWDMFLHHYRQDQPLLEMSRSIARWLKEMLPAVLKSPFFQEELFDWTLIYRQAFYDDCAKAWKAQFSTPYSPCHLMRTELDVLRRSANAAPYLRAEIEFITTPGSQKLQFSIPQQVKDILDIFNESFADYAACTILGASPIQYLLGFLGESSSIDEAVPHSFVNVFRIPTTLTRLGVSQAPREALQDAVTCLQPHGSTIRPAMANALADRIDQLFADYNRPEHAKLRQALNDYLKDCEDTPWAKSDFSIYRSLFQKLCLPQKERGPQAVVKMLEALDIPDKKEASLCP